MYPALKLLHVTSAIVSLSLFLLRGGWMLADSRLLQTRLARIAPHVVDTVLLGSAIALSVSIRQYPFVHDWLTGKVLAVVLYIVLGTIALKRGRTRRIRVAAFLAALAVFAWIVATARQHAVWLPVA